MSSFYSDPGVGGDGTTTTDDDNASTGLGAGGFRTRLVLMFTQIIAVANWIKTNGAANVAAAAQSVLDCIAQVVLATNQANAAAASAATAANSPNTQATSTTSDTIALGSTSITIQTGKALSVGQSVKSASTASPTNWMFGDITAYNSGTGLLTINVTAISGSGTFATWTVSSAGVQGTPGVNAFLGKVQRSTNTILGLLDSGKVFEITSGSFTQTFTACATLGSNWQIWYINNSGNDITLDPNGAELIDGVASGIMKSGMAFMITCDGSALSILRCDSNRLSDVLTSGTSWTAPLGGRSAKLRMSGGGASGYGATSGGGGGAGAYLEKALTLVPGTAYAYAVGAGGVGVTTGAGNTGGTSTMTVGAVTYTTTGGTCPNQFAINPGGTATNGDLNISGGNGAVPVGSAAEDRQYTGGSNPLSPPTAGIGSTSGNGVGYGSGGQCKSTAATSGAGKQGVLILDY